MLQSGFSLLMQQFKALLKKNALLSWRNRRASFLQLFSSFFFIFLIFVIDKAMQVQYTSSNGSVTNPLPMNIDSITPCEKKFSIKLPCYDFVWSGSDNPDFQTIVNRIMANNPGRPIPPNKVKSFKTKTAVEDWLYYNPMRCAAALHLIERDKTIIGYGIQTNSTTIQRRGQYEDPSGAFQLPLQINAEREIARYLIGAPNFSWDVTIREFPHPASDEFSSAVGSIGPTFFLAVAMFNFVLQMGSLVAEKELKLRQAMNMIGLYDSAYWLSWLTWDGIITLLSSLFIVLFGMLFHFDFFLKNSFAVLFFLFFLFELNLTGFAFFLSTFIHKSSSATTMGFSIFIVGFVTQIVVQVGIPYGTDYSKLFRTLWSFFPPNPFAKGLILLSAATATPEANGIGWNSRGKCAKDENDCVITINDIYTWLVVTFFLWFLLAIYFDNVIPKTSGVRKSVLYFLDPSYWMGTGGDKIEGGASCIDSIPPQEHITPDDDDDVLEEENTVKQQVKDGVVDQNIAVQICGLEKTYPSGLKILCCCGCCCKCRRTSPYRAVKGLWMNFAKNQLFCLLGPNGAGKTTTISCLTGINPVTGGDALIYGFSIRSSIGMSNIRKIIGVCPQFDILWDALSGEEHLQLFAAIKGLPSISIETITRQSLEEVKLASVAKVRAGSYSGGMKRRLSVAGALLGDPKLVILDEPTTGMDPITRRHVWDVIENAKRKRAILLTTHSMEEADILSDRIGIMAKGRLRCIGTSIRLKSHFGAGFLANISFYGNENSTGHRDAVKQLFKSNLDVVPKEENNVFLTFVIPHDRESILANFFEELQNREVEFGISDIQLGLTTLEEVFLNIAKQAEQESAVVEGTFETLTLKSGESVEIPKGARYVAIPGTESAENPRVYDRSIMGAR